MQHKNDKIAVLVQKHVSDILQFKVKKSDLGMITVTHCEVTVDYSIAKIYVSVFGKTNKQAVLEELKKIKGFVRSELAKKLKIYKTPDIVFLIDDSYEKSQRIEEVLKKIHESDSKKESTEN